MPIIEYLCYEVLSYVTVHGNWGGCIFPLTVYFEQRAMCAYITKLQLAYVIILFFVKSRLKLDSLVVISDTEK